MSPNISIRFRFGVGPCSRPQDGGAQQEQTIVGVDLHFVVLFLFETTLKYSKLILYCYLGRFRIPADMVTHMWKALWQPRVARIQIQGCQITRQIAVRSLN